MDASLIPPTFGCESSFSTATFKSDFLSLILANVRAICNKFDTLKGIDDLYRPHIFAVISALLILDKTIPIVMEIESFFLFAMSSVQFLLSFLIQKERLLMTLRCGLPLSDQEKIFLLAVCIGPLLVLLKMIIILTFTVEILFET